MLISKNEISSWESCKHITSNLASSYLQAFSGANVETLKVPEDFSLFTAFESAQKIKNDDFDLIIWLDHKPNASVMLEALNIVFEQTDYDKKPKFIIHLFGDFVLDCVGWESVEVALKNYPVHFITASDRQKKLVDMFCFGPESICSVIPFPVNESIFNVDNLVDNRQKYREKFNATNDFVVLYTGRISYQKNVDAVVKIFKSLETALNKKMQLWIIGPWDDIFLPYAGMKGFPGSYYSQFQGATSGIDFENGQVKFVGQLAAAELLKTYQAADLFMSLSAYNDEDYGMSVAEAMSTGLPCLLSDWGGFSSFKNYFDDVELVKVELTNDGPRVNIDEARKKLMKTLLVSENNLERRTLSAQKALGFVSINACEKKIKTTLEEVRFSSFEKFTPVFYKMCALFKMNPQSPFKGRTSQLSEFYKEIYTNYVS